MTGPIQIATVRDGGTPYNALLSGDQVSFAFAAAQLYGAVLASAAPGGAMPPDLAFTIGRTLGTRGWFTGLVQIDADGEPFIIPADLWAQDGIWTGTTRPLDGEIGRSVVAPDAAVVNVRLPDGQPPLSRINPVADIGARLDGSLIAELETPTARLIGLGIEAINTPANSRDNLTKGIDDVVERGGRHTVVPADVEQNRIGKLQPDPSPEVVSLRAQVRTDVEAAYGVLGLLSESAGSSTTLHGLWRVAVVRAFEPLAQLVELEAARKIGEQLRFDRRAWHAAPHSEIARATNQRAGAVQRLVAAGVDVERALTLVGMTGD